MQISPKPLMIVSAIAAAAVALLLYPAYLYWQPFSGNPNIPAVSGNIEAHQSVPSFNQVQTRVADSVHRQQINTQSRGMSSDTASGTTVHLWQ